MWKGNFVLKYSKIHLEMRKIMHNFWRHFGNLQIDLKEIWKFFRLFLILYYFENLRSYAQILCLFSSNTTKWSVKIRISTIYFKRYKIFGQTESVVYFKQIQDLVLKWSAWIFYLTIVEVLFFTLFSIKLMLRCCYHSVSAFILNLFKSFTFLEEERNYVFIFCQRSHWFQCRKSLQKAIVV